MLRDWRIRGHIKSHSPEYFTAILNRIGILLKRVPNSSKLCISFQEQNQRTAAGLLSRQCSSNIRGQIYRSIIAHNYRTNSIANKLNISQTHASNSNVRANRYRNVFHRDRKMNMSDLFLLLLLTFGLNISKAYFTGTVVFFLSEFVRFFDYFSGVTKPNGSPFASLVKFIAPSVYMFRSMSFLQIVLG